MDSKQLNMFFAAVIIILLFIIGVMLFRDNDRDGAYRPLKKSEAPAEQQMITKTTKPAENNTEIADETADWKTYENKALGFSFKYPSEYGNFNVSITNGEEGSFFRGGFPQFSESWATNKFFSIGGVSEDFGQGRSAYFLDFVRYAKMDGKYYHLMVQNKKYEFKPSKIMTVDGHEVLLVDGNSYTDDSTELGFGPGKNGGALINLSGNREFAGLAIWNSDIRKLPQAEFEKIISTFKFDR